MNIQVCRNCGNLWLAAYTAAGSCGACGASATELEAINPPQGTPYTDEPEQPYIQQSLP